MFKNLIIAAHDQKLDKKIAGIIQWLERLKKSYSSGAMENALMDAECAKADLEVLRRDVWKQVQPEKINSGFKNMRLAYSFFRTISLTLLIVLLAVVPISKDVAIKTVNIEINKPIKINTLSTEKISKNTALPETPKVNHSKNITKRKKNNPKISAKPESKTAKTETPKTELKTAAKKTVPYDKVYSLIQTGERALRNESYVTINK